MKLIHALQNSPKQGKEGRASGADLRQQKSTCVHKSTQGQPTQGDGSPDLRPPSWGLWKCFQDFTFREGSLLSALLSSAHSQGFLYLVGDWFTQTRNCHNSFLPYLLHHWPQNVSQTLFFCAHGSGPGESCIISRPHQNSSIPNILPQKPTFHIPISFLPTMRTLNSNHSSRQSHNVALHWLGTTRPSASLLQHTATVQSRVKLDGGLKICSDSQLIFDSSQNLHFLTRISHTYNIHTQ